MAGPASSARLGAVPASPVVHRLRCLLLALGFLAGIGRADTVEPLVGRLETGAAGAAILTLELPSAHLARLADKTGHEAEFGTQALVELIRERFRYLLRLRIGGDELAPTTIEFSAPFDGAPLPATLPLIAIWSHPGAAQGQVTTQTDSPTYRLALAIVANRGHATPGSPLTTTDGAEDSGRATSWMSALAGAAAAGFGRVAPGGIEQLFFVLGLCFAARGGKELMKLTVAFTVAHGLAFALSMGGLPVLSSGKTPALEAALALSLVAVAVAGCLGGERGQHLRAPLAAAFGLLYGVAFAQALSAPSLPWPESLFWPGIVAAHLGIGARQLAVIGAAGLLAGAWRRRAWAQPGPWYQPGTAVPASVVLGLGGLTLAWARAQETFTFTP